MRGPLLAAAVTGLLAAGAAPAHAGTVTIGSDLSADASITQSFPRDWAAWPTALASGGAVVSPVQGEVKIAQFKGTVLKPDNDAAYQGRYPDFHFRVVVMRPQPGGGEMLMVATQELPFPFGGDQQQITTFDLQQYEARICVQPGDHVALATSGGFGDQSAFGGNFPDGFFNDGYPVRMFAAAPGSTTQVFEQPAPGGDDGNGFQVGDVEAGEPRPGEELLMRATIGTGDDARHFCRSPEEQQGPTVSFPAQGPRLLIGKKAKKVNLQLSCDSLAACPGTLYLKLNGTILVGRGEFALQGRTAGTVAVTLNPNGLKKLKERKNKMKITAIAKVKGGKAQTAEYKIVRKTKRARRR